MHEVVGTKSRMGLRIAAVVLAAGCVLAACGGSDSSTGAKKASDLLNEGLQAQVQGDASAATAKFDAVLKVDPKNKFAYYNLGLIEQKANDNAKAESNYRQAIAIDPNYAPRSTTWRSSAPRPAPRPRRSSCTPGPRRRTRSSRPRSSTSACCSTRPARPRRPTPR